MTENDISSDLQQQVEQAYAAGDALHIRGGESKNFYGRTIASKSLNVGPHQGVVNYEPTELVITARAGTRLKELEQLLAENNQMFGFEPPAFGDTATLGGTIACNFSGPRRAFSGSARDFVLGSRIVNGKGESLRFGGEVMKNVAGYDVSRLMSGAMGTLGVLLEVSIKVLPKPETEVTVVHELGVADSLKKVHDLARRSLPISATCFDDNALHVRLSGTEGAVLAARKAVGGEALEADNDFWERLKEHQSGFFKTGSPVWRLSLASNSPELKIDGRSLYEWNGAQRWLISKANADSIRDEVNQHGGHAVCFRNCPDQIQVFHPLDRGLFKIHRQLKQAFDPKSILNPGKMYPEI